MLKLGRVKLQLKVKETNESVILATKETEKEKVEERLIAPTSDTRNIVTCS